MAQLLDVLAPAEQEGTKSVIRSWLKAVGDSVAVDDPLVELETDKVTMEVPAPAAGVVAEICLDSGADAAPGVLLARIRVGATAEAVAPASAPVESATAPAAPAPAPAIHVANGAACSEHRLSPSVRRAMQQHNVDPRDLVGSGRDGRITRADVDAHVAARGSRAPAAKSDAPKATRVGRSQFVPHDRMRLAIADHMAKSVSTAPHVTAVFEADFSAIMAHRKAVKPAYEKDGVNLTYTAYIVAACVAAMKAVPAVNSRWHADRLEIFDDINIGVGTALGDKGLIVPVVHGAQDLSLAGIARKLDDLTRRARLNKLTPGDVQGGTFSISNHGVSGSLVAAPIIINQPQSAILGVGKLEKRVVVREVDGVDTIQIRPMAFVSLSIDHRALDGHQTNAWLTRFVETLEGWPKA